MKRKLKAEQQFAGKYILVELIGVGGFAEVWKVRRDSGFVQALKIFSGLNRSDTAIARREFEKIYNLNHPNLLKPSDWGVFEQHPFLVLPYCSKGNALSIMGFADEKELVRLTHQVASGLAYLHGREECIIHQDIKPDNILIDDNNNYLLSDFGISKKLKKTFTHRTTVTLEQDDPNSGGTTPPCYRPPEYFATDFDKRRPIQASDIWAFGVTLFELATMELPFGDYGGLIQKNGAEIPNLPSGRFSHEFNHVIKWCMQLHSWDRPSAETLAEVTGHYIKTGKWVFPDVFPYKNIPVTTQKGTTQPPVDKKKNNQKDPSPKKTEPATTGQPVKETAGAKKETTVKKAATTKKEETAKKLTTTTKTTTDQKGNTPPPKKETDNQKPPLTPKKEVVKKAGKKPKKATVAKPPRQTQKEKNNPKDKQPPRKKGGPLRETVVYDPKTKPANEPATMAKPLGVAATAHQPTSKKEPERTNGKKRWLLLLLLIPMGIGGVLFLNNVGDNNNDHNTLSNVIESTDGNAMPSDTMALADANQKEKTVASDPVKAKTAAASAKSGGKNPSEPRATKYPSSKKYPTFDDSNGGKAKDKVDQDLATYYPPQNTEHTNQGSALKEKTDDVTVLEQELALQNSAAESALSQAEALIDQGNCSGAELKLIEVPAESPYRSRINDMKSAIEICKKNQADAASAAMAEAEVQSIIDKGDDCLAAEDCDCAIKEYKVAEAMAIVQFDNLITKKLKAAKDCKEKSEAAKAAAAKPEPVEDKPSIIFKCTKKVRFKASTKKGNNVDYDGQSQPVSGTFVITIYPETKRITIDIDGMTQHYDIVNLKAFKKAYEIKSKTTGSLLHLNYIPRLSGWELIDTNAKRSGVIFLKK